MDRTPPSSIRRLLRSEVNFGCPVPSCGNPYLEYHHFDPPFSVREHHNPEGMIALCTKHHPMADGGRWTKEDLRWMKQNPFLRRDKLTDQSFGWHRRELLLAVGGFYVNPSIFLRMNGQPVIWCERDDENRLQLNIDIRDQDNRPTIKMDNNDWLEISRVSNIKDIEMSPHAHSLAIRAPELGVACDIKFIEYSPKRLKKLGEKWDMRLDQRMGPQEPFPEFMIKTINDKISQYPPEEIPTDLLLSRSLLTQPAPTRWESLAQSIQEWPVTVCTMSLKLKYPFPVQIRPGKENIGGWAAGHTISFATQVVWDIRN